jgi:RNA polymerase sigma-70 factor, ECF subfamily
VESLQTAIVGAYTAARAAWPGCTLELARFGDELIRRLGADFDAASLGPICTEDVYLAIACLDGDPTAIGYLERDCLTEVDRAGRKLRATDDQIAEVRGHLRQILFTAEPGRAAALAGFTGRGDLRGYLRVIATRELIRAINRGRREEPIEELSEPLLECLDVSRAPELSLLRARHGEAIADALRAALDLLDERQRAVLRYSLVSGWSIDRIGELYGVHRATASRWVTAARDAFGEQLRREVSARLAIPLEDVDSIVRAVHSQIDVSLARIL